VIRQIEIEIVEFHGTLSDRFFPGMANGAQTVKTRAPGLAFADGGDMIGCMATPVSSIRNLGPAMEAAFARVGIDSAEALRALGTDAAYLRLLQSGHRPHFIAYYVIEMGLQGRPWNDCKGTEKAALRARFDALVSAGHDKGRSELEAALDAIGVVDPARLRRKPGQPTSSSPEKK
jgi:DNA transformation protein